MVLVYGEIFRMGNGLKPTIVKQGNKLYEMAVRQVKDGNDTIFHDTYMIMPVALDQMVKTFNLENVEEKHFFPHLYNRTENLDIVLPHLPPKEDYLHKHMKTGKKEAFERWYESAKNQVFCLKEQLASYCCSDVI